VALSPLELEVLEVPELPDLADFLDLCVLPDALVLAEALGEAEGLALACPELACTDRSTVVACAAPGRVAPIPSAPRTLAAPAAAVTERSRAWLRFRAATAARVARLSPPRLALLRAGIVSLSACVAALLALALADSLAADFLRTLCPG